MLAKPDLIENLGENALVHCITDSGKEFIVKTTDVALFEGKKEVALTTDRLRHFFNNITATGQIICPLLVAGLARAFSRQYYRAGG